MNIFQTIRDNVTAHQAGKWYGLRFDGNNERSRAFCPFHNDVKHPALGFFGGRDRDQLCHCFVCNVTADCIDLTARLLNCSKMEAAQRIAQDFNIAIDLKEPVQRKPKRQPSQRERERRKAFLMKVIADGNQKIKTIPAGDSSERKKLIDTVAAAMAELSNLD